MGKISKEVEVQTFHSSPRRPPLPPFFLLDFSSALSPLCSWLSFSTWWGFNFLQPVPQVMSNDAIQVKPIFSFLFRSWTVSIWLLTALLPELWNCSLTFWLPHLPSQVAEGLAATSAIQQRWWLTQFKFIFSPPKYCKETGIFGVWSENLGTHKKICKMHASKPLSTKSAWDILA